MADGWTSLMGEILDKDILAIGVPKSGKTTTCMAINEAFIDEGGCVIDIDVTGYSESAFARFPQRDKGMVNILKYKWGKYPEGLGDKHRLWIPYSNPPISKYVPDYSILYTIALEDMNFNDFKLFLRKMPENVKFTLMHILDMHPKTFGEFAEKVMQDFTITTSDNQMIEIKNSQNEKLKLMNMCMELDKIGFINGSPPSGVVVFKPELLKARTYNTFAVGHLSDEQKKVMIMNLISQIVAYRQKSNKTYPIMFYLREAHMLVPDCHYNEELQRTFIIYMKTLSKIRRHLGIQFLYDTQIPTSLHPDMKKLVEGIYVHRLTDEKDLKWVEDFLPETERANMEWLKQKDEMVSGMSLRWGLGKSNVDERPPPAFQLEPHNKMPYWKWVRKYVKNAKFINLMKMLPVQSFSIQSQQGEDSSSTRQGGKRGNSDRKKDGRRRKKKKLTDDEQQVFDCILQGTETTVELAERVCLSDTPEGNKRKIQRITASLKRDGWIESTRRGNKVFYSARQETIKESVEVVV